MGRPIISYFKAEKKKRLKTVSGILDRLLRTSGRSPDVWSVTEAVSRLTTGEGFADMARPCPYTRPSIGASDVVGMFTNIDRKECLGALGVFLDESWKFCPMGSPLKVKLKRRTVIWVGNASRSDRGAFTRDEILQTVYRALCLACFCCGREVRVQLNGLPLGHHLSAVLSRITVAHYEVRRVPLCAFRCLCGVTQALTTARWQDDTVFIQPYWKFCDVPDWKRTLTAISPTSLELEWSSGTGWGSEGASVTWTDLVVDYHEGRVRVVPKESQIASASDFRKVIPQRSCLWLWGSGVSICQNYFMRLVDMRCLQWGVWEVRAVLLLLAGYDFRNIAVAACNALCRRQWIVAATYPVLRGGPGGCCDCAASHCPQRFEDHVARTKGMAEFARSCVGAGSRKTLRSEVSP
eukprot:gene2226-biopygen518